MDKHFHQALYDDAGNLTRDCNACGKDLADAAHLHARECPCAECTAEAHTEGQS